MSDTSRLGSGWTFPVVPEARSGRLTYMAQDEKVRQSIYLILDTEPGERVMRPTFGCGLRRYLMKPNTVATRALIRRDVESALSAWEPRIVVNAVQVDAGDDPAMVVIGIFYTYARDGRADNLVYPFYLE
jgi:uncharacterized protein